MITVTVVTLNIYINIKTIISIIRTVIDLRIMTMSLK